MKFEHIEMRTGGGIYLPIPKSYKDCIELIKSDDYRVKGKKRSFGSIFLKLFVPYSNTFLIWFRLSQYHGFLHPLCKFMLDRSSRIHHLQISTNVKVGYGFYIGHGIDMVINPTTIIGNNVNLSNFLNIGTNHGEAAVIGDNVYIGPHVCLVGNVHLGSECSVGAGSVVVKDIEEKATVAGVPAKVLNKDAPGKFVNRRWINS